MTVARQFLVTIPQFDLSTQDDCADALRDLLIEVLRDDDGDGSDPEVIVEAVQEPPEAERSLTDRIARSQMGDVLMVMTRDGKCHRWTVGETMPGPIEELLEDEESEARVKRRLSGGERSDGGTDA